MNSYGSPQDSQYAQRRNSLILIIIAICLFLAGTLEYHWLEQDAYIMQNAQQEAPQNGEK